jgi:hypothetical protein
MKEESTGLVCTPGFIEDSLGKCDQPGVCFTLNSWSCKGFLSRNKYQAPSERNQDEMPMILC